MNSTTPQPQENPEPQSPEDDRSNVGQRFVGPTWIPILIAYLILVTLFLLYCLIQLWPAGTSVAPEMSKVSFLFADYSVSSEVRLILIVAIAGALGSQVHVLRSFFWYVGERKLVWSWTPMYVLLPFSGAVLGIVFYLVVRGGLFSQISAGETSPFGFAAVSGLVGLFSQQSVEKLKEVAENLLTTAPKGIDTAKPQPTSAEEAPSENTE